MKSKSVQYIPKLFGVGFWAAGVIGLEFFENDIGLNWMI